MDLHVYLNQQKENIVNDWIAKIVTVGDDVQFSEDNGNIYFDLLVSIDIPVTEHPLFEIIPRVCQYHEEKDTPIDHFLSSSHIWREILLNCIWEYAIKHQLDMSASAYFTKKLNIRIDAIQHMIAQIYWKSALDRRQLQQQKIDRLHQDRLGLLGQMAASVAHEIRNPLTAIGGFLKLIKTNLSEHSNQSVGRYLRFVEEELEGLYNHINSLLSFSKNTGMEEGFADCKIDDIVLAAMNLVKPRLDDVMIELTLDLQVQSCIYVQKIAIQQVLINLINNSIDALMDSNPRTIKIASYEDSVNYYISVEDNGPGIPEHIQNQMFTPFVTGKSNGTGLGLSICKQIMEKNAGTISFKSGTSGTVFFLSLSKECGLKENK